MALFSDVNMFVNMYSTDELVYDESAINNSILNIVCTVPGQRLFRPNFGCNVYHKLWEPMNESNALAIKNMITLAVERWEPRVILTATHISTNYSTQSYYIEVEYIIPALDNKSASYAFALQKISG